jgi:hypothetical protein
MKKMTKTVSIPATAPTGNAPPNPAPQGQREGDLHQAEAAHAVIK